MTDAFSPDGPFGGRLGLQARLTATFVVRQLLLLFVIGTLLIGIAYLFNMYDVAKLQGSTYIPGPSLCYKDSPICAPASFVAIYGFVLLIGVLFVLVPSERSFNFFFYGILGALMVTNYDHSVLDWVLRGLFRADLHVPNPVSVFKLLLSALLLSTVIGIHYNILADDFTKRMVRRGIPTEEAARIRPGMFKSLVPLLTVCVGVAGGFGLVGEFSALAFRFGLFPKIEILLLGIFGVIILYILRSIIKEVYQGGGEDEEPDLGPDTQVPP